MPAPGSPVSAIQLDACRLGPRSYPDTRVRYKPFDPTAGFRTYWWVDHLVNTGSGVQEWWSYRSRGAEVARVEILLNAQCARCYDVADPAEGFVEIALIEVREDHQRQGIGAAIVDRLLHTAYPGRPIAALSENDAFWYALGWTEHLRSDVADPRKHRKLFLSPFHD